jgi:hypothetical protein
MLMGEATQPTSVCKDLFQKFATKLCHSGRAEGVESPEKMHPLYGNDPLGKGVQVVDLMVSAAGFSFWRQI